MTPTRPATIRSAFVLGSTSVVAMAICRELARVAQAITIYLLSGTAGMASSLPGGIGVNEAATVLLLSQQEVPIGTGLPIAILRRLITPWSIVALASISGSWWKAKWTTAPDGVSPSPGSCVPSDTESAAPRQARK